MTKAIKLSELDIIQRIYLLSLLPKEGGFTQLIILKDLNNKLNFTQKELDAYDIKDTIQPDGNIGISYNPKKLAGKKFSFIFTPKEELEIKNSLQIAIDKKKLPLILFDLASKLKCADRKKDEQ